MTHTTTDKHMFLGKYTDLALSPSYPLTPYPLTFLSCLTLSHPVSPCLCLHSYRYIKQMDTDADGMVSYVEFKNFIETHLSPDIRPIRRLFDTIDTDGDGVVTHTELMLALRR